jgi:PAS domain S-box-containing protein
MRRREQRWSGSNDHFRLLVEHTSDIVSVLAPDGVIVYSSPSAERVLGLTPSELAGRQVFDFVHPDDLGRVRAAFAETLRTLGFAPPFEYRVRHADGSWLTVESMARRHDDGRVIASTRDVTAQRAAELALAERERQLLESQKLEALGSLAAGIAHDFNNLLHVIGGNAAFVRLKLDNASADASELDEIDKAVQTASELTGQLLQFYRRTDEDTATDVATVLAELEPILRRLLGTDVEFHIQVEQNLVPVALAAGHLEQIVMNLALNGRDALPDGGNIWIAASQSDTTITLTVADDGVGIHPQFHRDIFEPLWSTKPLETGTGLGLAIVSGILGQYGGSIAVESDVGAGTRFTVTLPVVEPRDSKEEEAPSRLELL